MGFWPRTERRFDKAHTPLDQKIHNYPLHIQPRHFECKDYTFAYHVLFYLVHLLDTFLYISHNRFLNKKGNKIYDPYMAWV